MKGREWLINLIIGKEIAPQSGLTYDKAIMAEYSNLSDNCLNMTCYVLGKNLGIGIDILNEFLKELGDFGTLLVLELLFLCNKDLISVETLLNSIRNVNITDKNVLLRDILKELGINISANINIFKLYECIGDKNCLPILTASLRSVGVKDNIFSFNFYDNVLYCDYIDIFMLKKAVNLETYRKSLFSVLIRKISSLDENSLNNVYKLLDLYKDVEDFNFVESIGDKTGFLLNNIWNLDSVMEQNKYTIALDTIYQLMLLPLYSIYEKTEGRQHYSLDLSITDYVEYLKYNSKDVIDIISKTYYTLLGVSFEISEKEIKEVHLTQEEENKIRLAIKEQYKRSLLGK